MSSTESLLNLVKFLEPLATKESEWTHTNMFKSGNMLYRGKYQINSENEDEFKKLYIEALRNGNNLGITERHLKEKAPMFLDLDFRWKVNKCENLDRQYTRSHIHQVVEHFISTISEYATDVDSSCLVAYVMEKDRPSCAKGMVKDGIHIYFPNLWFNYAELYTVFDKARERIIESKVLDDLNCENSYDDIFDKAPLRRNPLLLYGSKKSDTALAYTLTEIIEYDSEAKRKSIPNPVIEIKDLFQDLSIRRQEAVTISLDSNKITVKELPTPTVYHNRLYDNLNNTFSSDLTDDLKEEIALLLSLLQDHYVEEYQKWIDVGNCLMSIHPGLLDIGKEWSQKSDKYEEGCCEKHWRGCNKTIASLYYWVKLSNPEGYAEVKRMKDQKFFETVPGQISNYDVAKRLHDKYHDILVCTSLKGSGEWYIYDGLRWKVNHGGLFLRDKMSTELVREFRELAAEQQRSAINNPSDDTSSKKADAFNKCSRQLKQTRFKNETMTQCTELFFNSEFFENLDEQTTIVGYDNGVLCLEKQEFRSGLPEDNLSFSTGINYVPIEDIDEDILADIHDFLDKIFPNKAVKEYVITFLSSCLEGKSLEDFVIWTGVGGNGKSKVLELFLNCMGDYCKNLPVSLLTQKRASSNAATPELAQTKSCRMVYLQEPDENSRINVGLMKELSGNDKIQCRPLFKEPIEFKPQFKMLMLCNKLPEISATDGGTWRRLKVVEFTSEFVDNPKKPNQFKKDTDLSEKLKQWSEAFMAIMVDCYFNVFKVKGLRSPKEVARYTADYQKKYNFYKEFIEENLEMKEGCTVTLKDMYCKFKDWYKETKGLIAPKHRNDVRDFIARDLEFNSRTKCFMNCDFIVSNEDINIVI